MKYVLIAVALQACAVIRPGTIVFKTSAALEAVVGPRTQEFNEVMGCRMVATEVVEAPPAFGRDHVSVLVAMDPDEYASTQEFGYTSRWSFSEEVDIKVLLTDGKLPSWVLWHEYGHAVGIQHTADPCDIMWSPTHPDWRWHGFKCAVTDPHERLRALRARVGDVGKQFCPVQP